MIIFCEECGKKYRVDPSRIKGDMARLKCKACGHVITVSKPKDVSPGTGPTEDVAPEASPAPPQAPPEPAPATETPPDGGAVAKRAKPRGKFRFGLTAKVFMLMLFVSLVPLMILGAVSFYMANERIRSDTEQLNAQIASGLAVHVDEWIDKNLRVLQALAETPDIQSMNRIRQEPLLKAVGDAYPWMYLVFTLNPSGMNVARQDGKALRDYSDRQYYKDIMEGKPMTWQTLVGKTSKKPALILAVPIKRGGRIVGVLANAMTVGDISKRIATWRQGQTGYAFLVDEKAKVVAHPSRNYTLQQKNLAGHPLIAAFRNGKRGTVYFTDENGKAAVGHTEGTRYKWILAVQQEEAEAFQIIHQVAVYGLLIFALTIVAVFIISWISGRAITKPIKQLTAATEKISLGELDADISVKSKDEIGDLANAIQRMSESIRLSIERLRRRR
jgi:methyl-accepting chemotaxis protein